MPTKPADDVEQAALRALHEIALLAAGDRSDPVTVARVTAEHARRLLDLEKAAVVVWNEATGMLEKIYATEGIRQPIVAPGEGLVGKVFLTGEPVAVDDYQEYPDRILAAAQRRIVAAVAVPLLVEGRRVGVLGAWSTERRGVSEDGVRLLALFASLLAPAIAAAQSMARTRERHGVLEAFQEMARAIAGVIDPVAVAERCVRLASELLGADSAVIGYLDAESGLIRPLAVHGLEVSPGATVRPGRGAIGMAFERREPVVVNDYRGWAGAVEAGQAANIEAIVVVPLVIQDRAVGVLTVGSTRQRRFGPRDVEILGLFGSLVAPGLEAADLLAHRQREVSDLTALQEMAVAASGMLDTTALAELTVRRVRELLGVDSAIVRWHDPETGRLRLLASADVRQSLQPRELDPGAALSGTAFSEGRVIRFDRDHDLPEQREALSALGVASGLAVPLLARDRAVGALAVADYTQRAYDARALGLLTAFAALVGPALEAARLTAELATHEERLRTLYQGMACGIVVWDAEGGIVLINDTALDLFEVKREQLDGRMPGDIAGYRRVTEEGDPMAWEQRPMETARRTGRPVRNAVVGYEKPDGSLIWLQFDCTPVLDAAGHVRQVIGSCIDVGAVKRAEASRLESEAKSRFLASMSHELRTPLNAILGFTQLLESEAYGPLGDRQRRYVTHIANSGRHLLELVNEILDLSKVAAGRMQFSIEAVEVDGVLEEVLAAIRPLAGARTLEVRSSARAAVRADRRRVRQVLHNLLSNAIKFTEEDGSIRIAVECRDQEVVVAVHDSGVGIADDQKERIFEEFTQVDAGRNRRSEGTGLGLPLSKQLVEHMGGRVWVESRLGVGSSFYFALPAAGVPGIALTGSP